MGTENGMGYIGFFFGHILKFEYDNFFEIIVIFRIVIFFSFYKIKGEAQKIVIFANCHIFLKIVIFAKYDKQKNQWPQVDFRGAGE